MVREASMIIASMNTTVLVDFNARILMSGHVLLRRDSMNQWNNEKVAVIIVL